MSTRAIAICCWPGLPSLWLRGQKSGLLQALAFALLLNLILVTTLLPPPLMPSWSIPFLWGGLLVAWVVGVARAYRSYRELGETESDDTAGLFLQAQGEYLHGHWFEAESLLQEQLRKSRRDHDARLLLATLYRRTNRAAEAEQQLQVLQRMDGAEKWHWEIEREHQMLKRLATADRADTQSTSSS